MLIVSRYALQILQYALNTQILEQLVNIDIGEQTPYDEYDLKYVRYVVFCFKVILRSFGSVIRNKVSKRLMRITFYVYILKNEFRIR